MIARRFGIGSAVFGALVLGTAMGALGGAMAPAPSGTAVEGPHSVSQGAPVPRAPRAPRTAPVHSGSAVRHKGAVEASRVARVKGVKGRAPVHKAIAVKIVPAGSHKEAPVVRPRVAPEKVTPVVVKEAPVRVSAMPGGTSCQKHGMEPKVCTYSLDGAEVTRDAYAAQRCQESHGRSSWCTDPGQKS